MQLSHALHYPFQGKGWFRRILILTLVQLLPVVGQLILLGYGLDIVRAVYAGHTGLPPIRWLPALGDGLRFLLAGLLYLAPILLTIIMVGINKVGSSTGFGNLSALGVLLSIGLPLLLLVIRAVSVRRTGLSSVQRSRTRGSSLRFLRTRILPILVVILMILVLRTLVFSSGIDTGKLNGLGIFLLVVLSLLIFLIGIGLHVGGVRYAIEQKGLFAATTNAKLLLQNRAATGMLLLNALLLGLLAFVATGLGLVLLILPGLFVFVTCFLTLWYMLAHYGIEVGIRKPVFTSEESNVYVS